MREIAFAIPGDLATPTGGYVYARRLIDALPQHGWQARVIPLPGSYPYPSAADIAETGKAFADVAAGQPVIVDGLAFGAMPRELLAGHPLAYVALVHHPLADETGLTAPARRAFVASERVALACAHQVICTSAHTAQTLARDYDVPVAHITVARPGTDPVAPAEQTARAAEPILLTVATLTPRKGHLALVDALGGLRALPWRCVFVGSADRDPDHARKIHAAIAARGLSERITFTGALDAAQLGAHYRAADIFVLPSLHEGFGMAFAEALSHGLPVVGCAAGAVPEVVPPDAGILVPANDVQALSQALGRMIGDVTLRTQMGAAARDAAGKLSRWDHTARVIARALDQLVA